MKRFTFIIEKTHTGYSAFAADASIPVGTTGANMHELRENIVHALNLWREEEGLPTVTDKSLIARFDLAQFFDFYKVINASALAERIGMSQSLLSQYANGIKSPSEKQINRILSAVKALGNELTHLEFV